MIPPIEPSADIRQMASGLFQIYTAFVNEGFTPDHALELTAIFLRRSLAVEK